MSSIQKAGILILTAMFIVSVWIWREFGQPELLITWFIAIAGLLIQHEVKQ